MSGDGYEIAILSNIDNPSKSLARDISMTCNRLKISPKKSKLLYAYKNLIERNMVKPNETMNNFLKRKIKKGLSGITSVTVLTSPYPEINGVKKEFSCKDN